MTAPIPYFTSEIDTVELYAVYSGTFIKRWERYSFNSNYESPTDGWSATVDASDMGEADFLALQPGSLIELRVNGVTIGAGYIDSIARKANRQGGSEWTIEGRDTFAPVVDAHVDPRLQFKKEQTLAQIVQAVFEFFAPWGGEWDIDFDEEADEQVKLKRKKPGGGGGSAKKAKKRKARKGRAGKPVDQLRPGPHEGAYAFVEKLCHRHGMHLFPSIDGQTIILGEPDYDQVAHHLLVRSEEYSNILDGDPKWSVANQPSILIGDTSSGGGEHSTSKARAKMVNPFTGYDRDGNMWPEVKLVWDRYPNATPLYFETVTFGLEHLRWPRCYHVRPLFVHDEVARTDDELACFMRKEMSSFVRRALTVSYTVEGHGQWTKDGTFLPYDVDTIVQVRDEPGGLNALMWVAGRTFEKSRNGGTTTRLELIIPGSLQYFEDQK